MAASALLWSAIDAIETIVLGTTSGLRNLASLTNVLAAEVDNNTATSTRRAFARFHLHVKFVTAPLAGEYVALWFLPRQDNSVGATAWEDGDASTTPARPPDVIFPVRAVTTQQHIVIIAPLPPGFFKVLARNATGYAIANTNDTDSIVKMERFTPEAQ